jgi:tetratricopeptide (TPR) repeat protein/tRNA A-37 threonylcarbamoyl transferase component Bud32
MSQHSQRLEQALGARYRIERELGQGGMSIVYRAHDVRHDRKVALKVLRPDLAASIGSERFLREVRIAARLTHPHILPLHDSGEASGFLYYVMPYIEGESLRDRLEREGELPMAEVIRLMHDVADALAAAHRQGIVHRDVKPDNVLLAEGHAYVTDFGVAKALSDASVDQKVTSFGVAVGTPAYMAPEQAAADPEVDHRADIYALGAMAYEMLAGRPPFQGTSTQVVLAAQVTETPAPVTDHRPSVPAWLAETVMRCLEKQPADRWQSATEVRDRLAVYATSTGAVSPVTTQAITVSGETALRRSAPARVVTLYVGVAAAALGLVYFLMIRLGLPGWVFVAEVVLLALAFPATLLTGRAERRRARARSARTAAGAERGLARWLTWRWLLAAGGAGFAALGVGTAVYMSMRLLGIGPVGTLVASGVLEARERIVLADFANRTADSGLGQTLTELLRIDLAQSPTVTVLDAAQVAQVLQRMQQPPEARVTDSLALEIAVREGLKAAVTGEILSLGGEYVLSSRLVSVDGRLLWAGRQTASGAGGLIDAVDRLSASLRARVGESLRSIRADHPLAEVTTRSTEALRKYVQADRANNAADYDRSIRLLDEAIAEDSGFAMAYRKLGIILRNLNRDPDRAERAFVKAFELRDRLSERERYLAEAAYHDYVRRDRQAAIDAYRTLLEKYPTDRIALNNLAVAYSLLGRLQEAADLLVRNLALGGAPAATYSNAVGMLYGLGKADSARAVLEDFARAYPENPQVGDFRAAFAAAAFDYGTAEDLTRTLLESRRGTPLVEAEAMLDLARFALIRGRLAEAYGFFTQAHRLAVEHQVLVLGDQPWDVVSSIAEGMVRLRYREQPDSALAALERALRSEAWRRQPADKRDYLAMATLLAEAGRPRRARALIADFRSSMPAERLPEREAALQATEARIALAEGRPDEAIRAIRASRAAEQECPLCGLVELGEAHEQAGRLDSAVAAYERYLETPMLYRANLDEMNLPVVLRRLAALHERLGNRGRAVAYYDRFVELWARADPELQPAVADARRRLAELARGS